MARRTRRSAIATVLAVLLALESVGAVAAAAVRAVELQTATGVTAGAAAGARPSRDPLEMRERTAPPSAVERWRAARRAAAEADSPRDDARPAVLLAARERQVAALRAAADRPATSTVRPSRATGGSVRTVAAAASGGAAGAATGSTPATRYVGRNRVWIPSLGVNRSVSAFPCSRSRPPGHVVYRWGCAGRNNVYLFGHASSVFGPLHRAYVTGRLRVGMQVVYADGRGRVARYAVRFWRVVRPDGDIAWAYAAQSRPSMTLQTCVGSDSAFRLVVRLVKVG